MLKLCFDIPTAENLIEILAATDMVATMPSRIAKKTCARFADPWLLVPCTI